MRVSSPSIVSAGLAILASMTKWLSQCGQYSSLSSNSCVSLRKHFLHFLQAKVMSNDWTSGCCSCSAWHSAQSNHLRQHGDRIATCALRMCLHMTVEASALAKCHVQKGNYCRYGVAQLEGWPGTTPTLMCTQGALVSDFAMIRSFYAIYAYTEEAESPERLPPPPRLKNKIKPATSPVTQGWRSIFTHHTSPRNQYILVFCNLHIRKHSSSANISLSTHIYSPAAAPPETHISSQPCLPSGKPAATCKGAQRLDGHRA